jgi:hypothetical protein
MYTDTKTVSSYFDTVFVYRQNMEEDDRYTRITLRIPKDLHARLDAEADRTSKSLNAEIVSRLESTFETSSIELRRMIEAEMAEATHRGEKVNLRVETLKAQLALLNAQLRLKAVEAEHLASAAKTDADFAGVQEIIKNDFERLIAEGNALTAEKDSLMRERDSIVAHLNVVNKTLHEARAELEKRIARGMKARDEATRSKAILVGNIGRQEPVPPKPPGRQQPPAPRGPVKPTRKKS